VTYGAGGSTRDRTIRITSEITARTHIPTVAHLTCVGSTRQELIEILGKYRDAGIKSILALRGDPTGGPRAPWSPTQGGFNHADELVTLAAEFGGFTIGVAAFPDGHPASNGDFNKDVDVLIEKERRGATFATTQFFFEVDKWKKLVDKLSAKGSALPIIPGILPVTNVKQLNRMAELSGTPIPSHISEAFSKVEDNPDDVRKLGVEIATQLCQELLEAGAPGLHFYTMNTSSATREIYSQIKDER
jgi:methylenetetrahydrofolate reductase (NADPH)